MQKVTSNSSVGNVNDFIKLQISFNQAMLKKSKGNSVQIKLLQVKWQTNPECFDEGWKENRMAPDADSTAEQRIKNH